MTYAPPPLAPPATRPAALAPTAYGHGLAHVRGPWRGIVAILMLVVAFLVVSTALQLGGIVFDIAVGNTTVEQLAAGQIGFTPAILLTTNVSLAAMIPISMLLQRWLFGVRFRWLLSVEGRFRWRWMARLALIIVPVWAIYIGASFLVEPLPAIRFDASTVALIVIVILTTPLQAAGEEFGTRGLVQRATGSWFRNSTVSFIVGTLFSGALFGLAHLAGDPWLIAYYFLFGVSMSIAARWSGGLEAPILIHTVNNVFIFLPAVLFGQLDEGIDRSDGAGGPFVLLPIGMCLLAAAITAWRARRNGVMLEGVPPLTVPQERAEMERQRYEAAILAAPTNTTTTAPTTTAPTTTAPTTPPPTP
ncbi:MAG: CPBP family intramembrane glutamic endopeptidase [Microbacteriaceae bacterium]